MYGPLGPMMYAEIVLRGHQTREFSQDRPIAVGRSFAILTSPFAFLNAAPPSVTVRLILISFVLPFICLRSKVQQGRFPSNNSNLRYILCLGVTRASG
jgi:hypothetical protein